MLATAVRPLGVCTDRQKEKLAEGQPRRKGSRGIWLSWYSPLSVVWEGIIFAPLEGKLFFAHFGYFSSGQGPASLVVGAYHTLDISALSLHPQK